MGEGADAIQGRIGGIQVKTQLDFLGMQINVAARSRRRWLVVLSYALFGGMTMCGPIMAFRDWFGVPFCAHLGIQSHWWQDLSKRAGSGV